MNCQQFQIMAVIFCLFAFALCNLSEEHNQFNTNYHQNQLNYQNKINSLNAQIVSVPKNFASPCPKVFRYIFDGDEWEGWLRVRNPAPRGLPSFLRVQMSIGINYNSKYVGEISLAKDKLQSIDDLENGRPLRYKVKFPLQHPIPKITAIYYNNQLLCSGPRAMGQYVTTITLDHTFTTGISNPLKPNTNFPKPQIIQPSTEASSHFIPTELTPTVQEQLMITRFQCGSPETKTLPSTGLVIEGQQAIRGQFPWLAAYIHNGQSESGFICGGSLISQRLVLTAAHCIHNKYEPASNRRKPEEATFFFGKHNIESLTEDRNYIQSGAIEFHLHQDWRTDNDNFDADIAIVVLSRRIPFNKFIKPICLWTSTSSFEDIVEKQGIIAGWGKTEFDSISTSMPKWTKLPVVSNEKCIRSHPIFSTLTSDRTFCAGIKDSTTGPCNGDSGSGFITQVNNKFYLRGIVSSSLFNHVQQSCDTKNYAVFTDVTKYTTWIQSFMNRFG